jgi:hypothetical protein
MNIVLKIYQGSLLGASTLSMMTLRITTLNILGLFAIFSIMTLTLTVSSVVMLRVTMLMVVFCYCCAECHYAERRCAECRGTIYSFLCLIDFLRCPWVPEQVTPLHLFIILPGADALPRYNKNHNDI